MAKEKSKAKKKDKTDKEKIKKKDKKKAAEGKRPKTKAAKQKKISPKTRMEMIRTAAYYLAEKRGHHGRHELDDWIEAEKEIDATTRRD